MKFLRLEEGDLLVGRRESNWKVLHINVDQIQEIEENDNGVTGGHIVMANGDIHFLRPAAFNRLMDSIK